MILGKPVNKLAHASVRNSVWNSVSYSVQNSVRKATNIEL